MQIPPDAAPDTRTLAEIVGPHLCTRCDLRRPVHGQTVCAHCRTDDFVGAIEAVRSSQPLPTLES